MEAATDLQNIPGWSSNRIESYRISRYWRHIVSYPYRENYRSNKFDIPQGSWLLAYPIIRPNLLYYCC